MKNAPKLFALLTVFISMHRSHAMLNVFKDNWKTTLFAATTTATTIATFSPYAKLLLPTLHPMINKWTIAATSGALALFSGVVLRKKLSEKYTFLQVPTFIINTASFVFCKKMKTTGSQPTSDQKSNLEKEFKNLISTAKKTAQRALIIIPDERYDKFLYVNALWEYSWHATYFNAESYNDKKSSDYVKGSWKIEGQTQSQSLERFLDEAHSPFAGKNRSVVINARINGGNLIPQLSTLLNLIKSHSPEQPPLIVFLDQGSKKNLEKAIRNTVAQQFVTTIDLNDELNQLHNILEKIVAPVVKNLNYYEQNKDEAWNNDICLKCLQKEESKTNDRVYDEGEYRDHHYKCSEYKSKPFGSSIKRNREKNAG